MTRGIPTNFRYTGRQKTTSPINGSMVMVEYKDDNPGPGNTFWYRASDVPGFTSTEVAGASLY